MHKREREGWFQWFEERGKWIDYVQGRKREREIWQRIKGDHDRTLYPSTTIELTFGNITPRAIMIQRYIIDTTSHHWYNTTSLIQRYIIGMIQRYIIEWLWSSLWRICVITTTPTRWRNFSRVSSAVISYMKSNGELVLEKLYLLLHISVPLLLHVQLLRVWVGWMMEKDGGSEGGCISVFVSEFIGK